MYRATWLSAAGRLLLIAGTSMLLSPVAADVSFEGDIPSTLEMGSSYTIEWSTDADNVKITMVSGSESSNNIFHLYDVVCGVWIVNDMSKACTTTKDSVEWTPPDDLPIGHYMLMANAADDTEAFSSQFNLVEAGDGTSGGSSGGTSGGGSSVTSRPASTGSLVTSVFTTSSAGSVQVITTVSTALPGSTGTSDSSSDSNPTVLDGSGGLSTGAKAGIGVGAAIGGLLLLGGLGFAIFKMGRRSADHNKKETEDGAAAGKPTEDDNSKDGDEAAAAAAAQKLAAAEEGGGVAELQAPDKVHEAPDYRTRLEAPGRNEFVSELDATGGSFVIPPTSRPTTSATGEPGGSTDKAAGEAKGNEGEEATATTKKDGDAPSAAAEGAERASTSSGPTQSVRYETPDDIGRQPDK